MRRGRQQNGRSSLRGLNPNLGVGLLVQKVLLESNGNNESFKHQIGTTSCPERTLGKQTLGLNSS